MTETSRLLHSLPVLALLFSHGSSAEPARQGPNGGHLFDSGSHRVELALDLPSQKVKVFVNPAGKTLPISIGVTFTHPDGKRTMMELRALDLTHEPVQYQGSLEGSAQSYVGVELKIPLKKDRPIVLRSVELLSK